MLAFAYAERQSRFDLHDVEFKAEKSGSGYTLNGHKGVVFHAAAADKIIVSARTSGGSRDEKGITLFLVDGKAAGLSAGFDSAVGAMWVTVPVKPLLGYAQARSRASTPVSNAPTAVSGISASASRDSASSTTAITSPRSRKRPTANCSDADTSRPAMGARTVVCSSCSVCSASAASSRSILAWVACSISACAGLLIKASDLSAINADAGAAAISLAQGDRNAVDIGVVDATGALPFIVLATLAVLIVLAALAFGVGIWIGFGYPGLYDKYEATGKAPRVTPFEMLMDWVVRRFDR
mgnify:CR=1 FL=1